VTIRVVQGHAPDVLSQMEAESVHLVCTSPPYFQLRSYGTEPQVWPNPDGTPLCADGAHEWEVTDEWHNRGDATAGPKQQSNVGSVTDRGTRRYALCARCGCWLGELGQEPTVEPYLADLVSVFDAVRRVLRRDGLCWVNLSGSYFNNPGGQNGGVNNGLDYGAGRISRKVMEANRQAGRQDRIGAASKDSWLKPLDWVDTPGLFAHAMQRAGWYWRADIALVKKAPLPESVSGWKWERCRTKMAKGEPANVTKQGEYPNRTVAGFNERYFDGVGVAEWADCPGCSRCEKNDGLILRRGNGRPTRAWERFLVFAKAPGAYFDSEAVREPGQEHPGNAGTFKRNGSVRGVPLVPGNTASHRPDREDRVPVGRNLRDWQFWPGSEMVRLRSDLTPEQRASVLRSIADAELLSSGSSDESSSEPPDAQT
jgi:DNA modification methylase